MLARVRGCVRACTVACACARLRARVTVACVRAYAVACIRARVHGCARACVRARVLACVRRCVCMCVRPSRFTILSVPHTHCSFYRTTQHFGPYFLHIPTVQCPMLKLQNCSMHYNIFSLQRTLYFFIPTQQWISGSGADPFAALVISTPVSNFILNSETTCSYLFILLKVSIGSNLQLLKFSNNLSFCSVYKALILYISCCTFSLSNV